MDEFEPLKGCLTGATTVGFFWDTRSCLVNLVNLQVDNCLVVALELEDWLATRGLRFVHLWGFSCILFSSLLLLMPHVHRAKDCRNDDQCDNYACNGPTRNAIITIATRGTTGGFNGNRTLDIAVSNQNTYVYRPVRHQPFLP